MIKQPKTFTLKLKGKFLTICFKLLKGIIENIADELQAIYATDETNERVTAK